MYLIVGPLFLWQVSWKELQFICFGVPYLGLWPSVKTLVLRGREVTTNHCMIWFPGLHCGHKQGLPVLFQEVESIQTSIWVNTETHLATNHWIRYKTNNDSNGTWGRHWMEFNILFPNLSLFITLQGANVSLNPMTKRIGGAGRASTTWLSMNSW